EAFTAHSHKHGPLTEKRQAVSDIGPGAAALAFQRVDQKRDRKDVHLVGQDVVAEPPREDHDVVIGDGTGDKNAHRVVFLSVSSSKAKGASPWDLLATAPGSGRSGPGKFPGPE